MRGLGPVVGLLVALCVPVRGARGPTTERQPCERATGRGARHRRGHDRRGDGRGERVLAVRGRARLGLVPAHRAAGRPRDRRAGGRGRPRRGPRRLPRPALRAHRGGLRRHRPPRPRAGRASTSSATARTSSASASSATPLPGTFGLTLQFGRPPASPPGDPLPAGGASGTLQRVTDPSVAYSVDLRAGVTYRFNLATGSCTPLSLFGPGTTSFARLARRPRAVRRLHPLHARRGRERPLQPAGQASNARAATRYRLMAGPRPLRRHGARAVHPQLRPGARQPRRHAHRRRRPLPLRRHAPQRPRPHARAARRTSA